MNESNNSNEGTPRSRGQLQGPVLQSIRLLLYAILAVTATVFVQRLYKAEKEKEDLTESQDRQLTALGVTKPIARHLAAEYSDKSGRLLADPPTDAQKLLQPETLVLAYGEDSDLEVQPIDWEGFRADLERATGKTVNTQPYTNTVTDVADFKSGRIHLVALHAADTPYLVNNAGFIPLAVVGSNAGAIGNHLDLAVPANSPIKQLADLKGHTLAVTTPVSITGNRAAVAVLLEEANLRPNVDYTLSYSLSQTRSILGIASGDFEAAAWSDDKLQTLLKAGRIKPGDYRIIYESRVIPRFTIGMCYNLDPELADKVRGAIVNFKNAGGPVEEDTEQPLHFIPVDYKRDFEFVRKIDESFEPRFGPKPPKSESAKQAAN